MRPASKRRPVWRVRATCPRGHILCERLIDPADGNVLDLLADFERLLRADTDGALPWCALCGSRVEWWDAIPARYDSLGAARADLASEVN